MMMIQESQEVSNQPKPLRIIGDPDKVEGAKRLINEIMNGGREAGDQGGRPFDGANARGEVFSLFSVKEWVYLLISECLYPEQGNIGCRTSIFCWHDYWQRWRYDQAAWNGDGNQDSVQTRW